MSTVSHSVDITPVGTWIYAPRSFDYDTFQLVICSALGNPPQIPDAQKGERTGGRLDDGPFLATVVWCLVQKM